MRAGQLCAGCLLQERIQRLAFHKSVQAEAAPPASAKNRQKAPQLDLTCHGVGRPLPLVFVFVGEVVGAYIVRVGGIASCKGSGGMLNCGMAQQSPKTTPADQGLVNVADAVQPPLADTLLCS